MTRPKGIDYQIVAPVPPEKLARMDVAAFVGFALSGPVDTPVAVEDPLYFQEIFGPDLALAWDPLQGQPLYGYLGPAVRAFFRNGGQRCWVVRVANEPVTNHFPVPGLMQASGDRYWGVDVQARSPGSWSDGLRVGTVLHSARVGNAEFDGDFATTQLLYVTQAARIPIRPGDLLRVRLKDGILLYFAVEDATELPGAVRPAAVAATTRWRLRGLDYWFRTIYDDGEGKPENSDAISAATKRLDPPGGPADSDAIWADCWAFWFPPGRPDIPFLLFPAPRLLGIGNLMEVKADASRLLFSVAIVETDKTDAPVQPYMTALVASEVLEPLKRSEGRGLAQGGGAAERLTLSLWVTDEHGRTDRLTDLGFTPRHPRFLGNLPADEAFFRPDDEPNPVRDALRDDVAYPRFPVAALPVPHELATEQVMLPIGMGRVVRTDIAGTAAPQFGTKPQGGTKLERDGLGRFDLGVFLDPDLRETPSDTLLAAATAKRHVQMQQLKGVHAVLPLEEVTLLCLPDLVHTGWIPDIVPDSPPQTAPTLAAGAGAPPGHVRLIWDAPESAEGYTLQTAADADFTQSAESHDTAETSLDLPAPAEAGRQTRHCRVRARSAAGAGPWSNTVTRHFSPLAFQPHRQLATPTLQPFRLGHVSALTWTRPENATSLLQTAPDPDFRQPAVVYEGAADTCTVLTTGYYRVRAYRDGEMTPWSQTLTLVPAASDTAAPKQAPLIPWRTHDLTPAAMPADRQSRAAVHRSVLRLCHARGDLFAVLSLPAAYRENDAVDYVRTLAPLVGAAEAPALSYGALYYPWLVSETLPGEERPTPPDGPVTGLIASLSRSRGVWRAPIYKHLKGVTGLRDITPLETYAQMLDEGINMIIHPPEGVLIRSAQSLSLDESLRPINVRRLLMLIRRRALQEGNFLVFEPNSEAFRRAAVRRFERMLTDLFVQGAFAGATPADSFKVSIDPADNTPALREQGRLVIDLAVAPVQPLVFLTVRVVQAEDREPVFSEGSA